MKITNIEVKYPTYKDDLKGWRPKLWQIITKISTDKKNIFGFGTGGGGHASIEVINGHLGNLIINEEINNKQDIIKVFEKLYEHSIPYGRGGIATMAISSLDLAIWDAFSKYYEIPIKNLLEKNSHKHHNTIETYATGNNVKKYSNLSINNFKLSVRSSKDVEKDFENLSNLISNTRESIINTKKIMLDCYMTWDLDYAKNMSSKLKDFNIEWIEDICTPDIILDNKFYNKNLFQIQIAGGEHEFNHNNFKLMKNHNSYDIWQPDVTWCGGISALLKIISINSKKYKIILHRGGEPWGLPLIESGLVYNMAELHNPKTNNLELEQWNNKSINAINNGFLKTNNYLGFGSVPKKEIFE